MANRKQEARAVLTPRQALLTTIARRRTRCAYLSIKRTPQEKARLKERRLAHKRDYSQALEKARAVIAQEAEQLHAEFGAHSVDYYYEEIMQHSQKAKSQRSKINRWNAFTRQQAKLINSDEPSTSNRSIAKLSQELALQWKNMSEEERIDATEDAIKELEEQREMKKFAARNTAISSFHDARATLETIEKELHALHARTGTEVVMIAVKPNCDKFGHPAAFVTSQRPEEFFNLSMKCSVADVAVCMEAFCISGASGVAKSYSRQVIELKSSLADLLLEKLRAAAGVHVPRMYYTNFDRHITLEYQVIIENWPLRKLCKPSDIGLRTEVQLVLDAFISGAARFRRLSADEFAHWEKMQAIDSGVAENRPLSPSNAWPSETTSHSDSTSQALAVIDPSLTMNTVTPTTESRKRPATEGIGTAAVSSIMGVGGVVIPPTKKPCKPRKDKGVPRKRKVTGNTPQSGLQTASAPPSQLTGSVATTPAS